MERASSSSDSSSSMASSILSRTSSSSSSAVDDYIGTESCFDVLSADEENEFYKSESIKSRYRYGGRRREEREARAAAAREFPPPIPLLAQTGNLLPHMPWVLKRVVTSDGRLILREEKVRHHEYFRADRSNGRLTLHLVPLDYDVFQLPHYQSDDEDDENDDDDDDDDDENEDDEDENEDEDDYHQEVVENNLDDLADSLNKSVTIDKGSNNVVGDIEDGYRKAMLAAVAVEETLGSPRGKCLKSCFVGMRVQEIRPVLS